MSNPSDSNNSTTMSTDNNPILSIGVAHTPSEAALISLRPDYQYISSPMNYYQPLENNKSSSISCTTTTTTTLSAPQTTTISPPQKRKNHPTSVKLSVPATDVATLPKELLALFKPLNCELCKIQTNSTLSAKMHYQSKNHDKKINNWLSEWSKISNEPIPKRMKRTFKVNNNNNGTLDGGDDLSSELAVGPNAFHCEICDLALTSQQHAQQHYLGKRHRSAAAGRSNPHGSGYIGIDGKWIRTGTTSTDQTGRFNIGTAFIKTIDDNNKINEDVVETTTTTTTTPETELDDVAVKTIKINDKTFTCLICNINTTSSDQMEAHKRGSKHAKRLKIIGAAPPPIGENDSILQSLSSNSTCSTDEINQKQEMSNKNQDISIYRTPSGNYYCKPCDCTISTESMFIQHLDSKSHHKLFSLF